MKYLFYIIGGAYYKARSNFSLDEKTRPLMSASFKTFNRGLRLIINL